MDPQREKRSKTSKEMSGENTVPKPKENTSKSLSKAPPRKYGAHSGLKFNFNVKKGVVVNPFSFETRTESDKGNASTISRKTDLKHTNKEVNADLGDREEKFMENLKISKPSGKPNNNTQSTRSAPDDSVIPSENKNTGLCSNVAKSLQHLCLNRKVLKSQVSNTMKPQPMPQSSNTLQVPSSATLKPQQPLKDAKALPTKFAKPQTPIAETDLKKPHKKYGAHAGLKFPSIGKKETVIRPFRFASRSPSSSRKCCFDSDGKQAESKEMSTPEGSHQKK